MEQKPEKQETLLSVLIFSHHICDVPEQVETKDYIFSNLMIRYVDLATYKWVGLVALFVCGVMWCCRKMTTNVQNAIVVAVFYILTFLDCFSFS